MLMNSSNKATTATSRRRTQHASSSRQLSIANDDSILDNDEDNQGCAIRTTHRLPATGSSGSIDSTNNSYYGSTSIDSSRHAALAQDPLDLGTNPEDHTGATRLTLMEEVLLLGLKDKEGLLSFWNESLSYVLRGCVLAELAIRGRIRIAPRTDRHSVPLPLRPLTVVCTRRTGEPILDEALRLIHTTETGTAAYMMTSITDIPAIILDPTSTPTVTTAYSVDSHSARGSSNSKAGASEGKQWGVAAWIDLFSGDTWNILKVSYQLRQVRERLAKGLVEKGVLRNDKRNFLFFDLATHPLADHSVKQEIVARVINTLLLPSNSVCWSSVTLRSVVLLCAACAGNVISNALTRLPFTERDLCFRRMSDLFDLFSRWDDTVGETASQGVSGVEHNEIVAAVITVFSRMDSGV